MQLQTVSTALLGALFLYVHYYALLLMEFRYPLIQVLAVTALMKVFHVWFLQPDGPNGPDKGGGNTSSESMACMHIGEAETEGPHNASSISEASKQDSRYGSRSMSEQLGTTMKQVQGEQENPKIHSHEDVPSDESDGVLRAELDLLLEGKEMCEEQAVKDDDDDDEGVLYTHIYKSAPQSTAPKLETNSMRGGREMCLEVGGILDQEGGEAESLWVSTESDAMLSCRHTLTPRPSSDRMALPSSCNLMDIIALCKHELPAHPYESLQVQITVPSGDPSDLGQEALRNLGSCFNAALSGQVPGTQVVGHSVRKGSIMVSLDVIYLGEVPVLKDGSEDGLGDTLQNLVKPEVWCEWLQLPWPKDGQEVLVQVGEKNALAVKWDGEKQQWVSSKAPTPLLPANKARILSVSPQALALPRRTRLTMQPTSKPSLDLSEVPMEAPNAQSSSSCSSSRTSHVSMAGLPPHLEVRAFSSCADPTPNLQGLAGAVEDREEGTIDLEVRMPADLVQALSSGGAGPKLRARFRGYAVPLTVRMAQDVEDLENAKVNAIGTCMDYLEMGDCMGKDTRREFVHEDTAWDDVQPSSDSFKSAQGPSKAEESPVCSVLVTLHIGAAVANKGLLMSPGLLMLEVWEQRVLIQSIPVLVLSPDQQELAKELEDFLESSPPNRLQDPALWEKMTNSHISKLGLWLEYTSSVGMTHKKLCTGCEQGCRCTGEEGCCQSTKKPSADLHRYMVAAGKWLLELSMIRGWLHCYTETMLGLLTKLDTSFAELALEANSNGHTMLHLAVLSGKAYMVAAAVRMAARHNFKLRWDAQDKHGVTPMHIVATSSTSGTLARSLLKHFDAAAAAWRSSKGGLGVTPEAIAAQLGMVFPHGKKKKRWDVVPRAPRLSRFAAVPAPLGADDGSLTGRLGARGGNGLARAQPHINTNGPLHNRSPQAECTQLSQNMQASKGHLDPSLGWGMHPPARSSDRELEKVVGRQLEVNAPRPNMASALDKLVAHQVQPNSMPEQSTPLLYKGSQKLSVSLDTARHRAAMQERQSINAAQHETTIQERQSINAAQHETTIQERQSINAAQHGTAMQENPSINAAQHKTGMHARNSINAAQHETAMQERQSLNAAWHETAMQERHSINSAQHETAMQERMNLKLAWGGSGGCDFSGAKIARGYPSSSKALIQHMPVGSVHMPLSASITSEVRMDSNRDNKVDCNQGTNLKVGSNLGTKGKASSTVKSMFKSLLKIGNVPQPPQ